MQNSTAQSCRRQRRARGRCTTRGNCIALPVETPVTYRCDDKNSRDGLVSLSCGTVEEEHLAAEVFVNDQASCNAVIHHLENADCVDKHKLLLQIHAVARRLALSKNGCRIVQKAFEVASNPDRDVMIEELKDHVTELYQSPHGNYVLSKAIEVLPAAKTSFIISAVRGRGITISKHRFGCRVICRLLEHCSEEQIGELLDEILAEAAILARHGFGNFVIQTALEHLSPARRTVIVSKLLPGFASMCLDRSGSLVAQRLLDSCGADGQHEAILALLRGEAHHTSLVDVACSHYGSYVLVHVAALHAQQRLVQDIRYALLCNLQQLNSSEHAQRVIDAFWLKPGQTAACVE